LCLLCRTRAGRLAEAADFIIVNNAFSAFHVQYNHFPEKINPPGLVGICQKSFLPQNHRPSQVQLQKYRLGWMNSFKGNPFFSFS